VRYILIGVLFVKMKPYFVMGVAVVIALALAAVRAEVTQSEGGTGHNFIRFV